MSQYDVIVIGVGSMGSAACYWLSRKGSRVLGLEQFSIPHEFGAHTGQSRIIRKAYFEHPDYVPLLEKAYNNWQHLEDETGIRLYHETGLIYLGPPGNPLIDGVRKAATLYDIPIEELDRKELNSRFPQFVTPRHYEHIYEPVAGFITPEKAITVMAEAARRHGCAIHQGETVLSWERKGDGLRIITDKSTYDTRKLVITAGPWTTKIQKDLPAKLDVTRQVVAWVDPPDREPFLFKKFPCWLLEDDERGIYYGFPILPSGEFEGPSSLKIAHHFPGKITDPDKVERAINPADEEDIRYALEKYFPAVGFKVNQWKTCLYANSADEHFIIDQLPGFEGQVSIACGFSGHGFKFAPVVGEILSEFALEGKSSLPIGFLGFDRFKDPGLSF